MGICLDPSDYYLRISGLSVGHFRGYPCDWQNIPALISSKGQRAIDNDTLVSPGLAEVVYRSATQGFSGSVKAQTSYFPLQLPSWQGRPIR